MFDISILEASMLPTEEILKIARKESDNSFESLRRGTGCGRMHFALHLRAEETSRKIMHNGVQYLFTQDKEFAFMLHSLSCPTSLGKGQHAYLLNLFLEDLGKWHEHVPLFGFISPSTYPLQHIGNTVKTAEQILIDLLRKTFLAREIKYPPQIHGCAPWKNVQAELLRTFNVVEVV